MAADIYRIELKTFFGRYLGPGKGPGTSFEHSSTRNIIQHPRRSHVPGELAARALHKDTWNVTVPDSFDDLKTAK